MFIYYCPNPTLRYSLFFINLICITYSNYIFQLTDDNIKQSRSVKIKFGQQQLEKIKNKKIAPTKIILKETQ